jgi:hypothetical protein
MFFIRFCSINPQERRLHFLKKGFIIYLTNREMARNDKPEKNMNSILNLVEFIEKGPQGARGHMTILGVGNKVANRQNMLVEYTVLPTLEWKVSHTWNGVFSGGVEPIQRKGQAATQAEVFEQIANSIPEVAIEAEKYFYKKGGKIKGFVSCKSCKTMAV